MYMYKICFITLLIINMFPSLTGAICDAKIKTVKQITVFMA